MADGIRWKGHGTQLAEEDLSTKKSHGVKLGASGYVLCDTLGEFCEGVLTDKPEEGQSAGVEQGNPEQDFFLGGVVAYGDPLTVNANGEFIKATVEGQFVKGKALQAGVAGQEINGINYETPYALPAP